MPSSTALPQSPPPSVGKLDKYVLAYANVEGVAVGRVRHWISFMLLSGALDRAARSASRTPGAPHFIVKGGVALELRLPGRARATDDLDIVVVCDEDDLVVALDTALNTASGTTPNESYLDCTFTRKPDVYPLGDKGVRVWIHIAYRSQRWATVQVDLAKPDATDTETERLGGIPLTRFGLAGPRDVACLSLRYHIAQKFHGMTKMPHDGVENDRFRDVVDLLLLRALVADDDLPAVREACEETFRVRGEHAWPPAVALPTHWRAPFAALAAAVKLPVADLTEAESALRVFVDELLISGPARTDGASEGADPDVRGKGSERHL